MSRDTSKPSLGDWTESFAAVAASTGTMNPDANSVQDSTSFLLPQDKQNDQFTPTSIEAQRNALIAQELEHYTRTGFVAINARDWAWLNQRSFINRIAYNMETSMGTGTRPHILKGREAYISDFQRVAREHPDFNLHVISLSTVVHDPESEAEVLANCEVSGMEGVPKGLSRKTVTILDWKKIDGVWQTVKETTIAGNGEDRVSGW